MNSIFKLSLLLIFSSGVFFIRNAGDSDFERANKAVFYRTQTERQYIKLYAQFDSLRNRCDFLQTAMERKYLELINQCDSLRDAKDK